LSGIEQRQQHSPDRAQTWIASSLLAHGTISSLFTTGVCASVICFKR